MTLRAVLSLVGIEEYCVVSPSQEFVIYPHKLEKLAFPHNTAIMCLFPYCVEAYPRDAMLSRYASAPDYHKVAGRILAQACEKLSELFPDAHFSHYADDSPYCEKDLAASGGLIIRGRNDIGLSRAYGQLFFIGEIVTDAILPHEYRTPPVCCSDAPCIKSCPTGAIGADGFIRERCLSYISQKGGAEFTDTDAALFSRAKYAWGCDICLNACVKNKGIKETHIGAFHDILPYIAAEDIEHLSNREYREKFADRVYSGRSKNIMLRNLRHLKEKI